LISSTSPIVVSKTVDVYNNITVRANFSEQTPSNMSQLVLSTETEGYWGEVPGKFNNTYNITVEIEEFNHTLGTAKPVEDIGKRVYELDPVYKMKVMEYGNHTFDDGSTRETVTVSPELTIDWLDYKFDEELITLNYEALSAWDKLKSPPKYSKAW